MSVPQQRMSAPAPAQTTTPPATKTYSDRWLVGLSWLLRAALAVLAVWQLLHGNTQGAIVAGQGLAITFLPPIVSRLGGRPVPRLIELIFVGAMAFQYGSESLKLFELLTYWDKIVHPTEIFLATAVVTFLLLGYREVRQLDIPDGMAAVGAMLMGMTIGATWELVEFAFDWFGNANLQKSNADTMTDILTNNTGAIFGALLGFWLYRHRTTNEQRQHCGEIAVWLTDHTAPFVMRHGVVAGVLLALAISGLVFAGWLMDRHPLPPAPSAQGGAADWRFAGGAPLDSSAAVLSGEWQPNAAGICRTDAERPAPGSEKLGLLALAPGQSYGDAAGFRFAADYLAVRPPLGAGTAMQAGLAFGIRDPDDYYLLEISAIHDVLVLEHYINGHKRWVREARVRTRGDEWHQLALTVQADTVSAYLDDQLFFQKSGLPDTGGGIGLWARATQEICFSAVRVEPLSQAPALALRS